MAYASLAGRTVEDVRVMGNTQVPTAVILNVVRARAGDKFDPATVEEDYQRIYEMRKFSNVQAKVEPTSTGVIVTFIVSEQKQIRKITFKGNVHVDTQTLFDTIDVHEAEAIDSFRISIARSSIENLYKSKNYPYAHVSVNEDLLVRTGNLHFDIVEGPNVKVRKVDFVGNRAFSDDRLRDQVQTKYWIWIFRPGTYNPDTVEDDVAALRRFYQDHGFFDVRVGRKITESPDQTEIRVTFIVNEGVRYIVDKVSFQGNTHVSDQQLRRNLKLTEGQPYDFDTLQSDVHQVVRAYSPFGYIYAPTQRSPDYLQINPEKLFHKEAGKVDIRYHISEGKSFKLGRILVKGNGKTQEKVVLREMRVQPGQTYNSAELQDAADRLRATPYFQGVQMTPIGDDPHVRDLLVEVTEAHTASFGVGAGINSNGGVGGDITYEQRNFDITDLPTRPGDIISDRAFIGAGQDLRLTLQPGTIASNASIQFTEPWLFDQPYSLTTEAYWRDRVREDWDETRAGGRVTLGKRFNNVYSASLTLRGEDVKVHSLGDDADLVPDITEFVGHNTLSSAMLLLRRDTTNPGVLPYTGTNSSIAWESYGALGGEFTFQKFTGSLDWYIPLYTDLLDRKTVLALRGDTGWIWGSAPFFERFYGGGIGTIRGFRFRGVGPHFDGPGDLPIGGDFTLTGSAELGFPLYGENLRGVVFTDVGTVEPDVEIGTIRSSVGLGFRLILPMFGRLPIAIDFAAPITKAHGDETQWISFSLGFQP
jgi:outer membrane protein assembly factor BamA